MNKTHRELFAERLNQLCDDMGVSSRPYAREKALAAVCEVTPNAARKWLLADSYPNPENIEKIVDWGAIRYEWLMRGRGDKTDSIQGGNREQALLELYRNSDKRGQDLIIRVAEQESSYHLEPLEKTGNDG